MKILVVSLSAPPKNSPESVQTGRYIQHLSKKNDVTLLTTKVSGGWEPNDPSLNRYIKDTRQLIALSAPHPRVINLLNRFWPSLLVPDEGVFFVSQFNRARTALQSKPEVIFSRSAPFSSALMALNLSEYFRVPWIMHLSDPWANNPFLKKSIAIRNKHSELETKCIERANVVTLTSKKTIEFYKKKYPQYENKFQFLPNVFDDENLNDELKDFQQPMKFVFTGRLYGARSLHRLLDAIEEAARTNSRLERQTEFIFAGFFDQSNVQRIESSTLSNLRYLGALSLDKAIELQKSAAVLLSIDSLEDEPMVDLFFPSKLLDYFMAKRPIIAITRVGSTSYELVEGKFGKCFSPENLSTLPQHINRLVEKYFAGDKQVFSPNGDFLEYSAQRNAERLEEMLTKLVAANG